MSQQEPGRTTVPGLDAPRPERRGRSQRPTIIVMLALGWIALFWATSLSLLAAIQVGMIGLGAIGSAIVAALWRAS
jgi:hypothetical protein